MASCCEDKACEIDALRASHRRVLWAVFAINAAMFVVECSSGIVARSTALLADSLDMLGDALVYGVSLFALSRSARWQAGAALAKGAFMFAFGLGVLAEAIYKTLNPVMPAAGTMGIVGLLALCTNAACFGLLYRHRADNLNLRSTWLCSRNDLIANAGVLLAAGATFLLVSRWPDVVVGIVIAALFLRTAFGILVDSGKALRTEPVVPQQRLRSPRPATVTLHHRNPARGHGQALQLGAEQPQELLPNPLLPRPVRPLLERDPP